MIDYTSRSNNNRYTFKLYKEQIVIQEYTNSTNCSSCLGGMTSSFNPEKFDKALIKLYANKTANGNNHWNADEELYTFFLNYIKSLFPIFKWNISETENDYIINLNFSFDIPVSLTQCNQMKLICNLARRLYESPRSYQLRHAYELYKQNWHNLDFYQILLIAELSEYYSTNDHKLLPFMISILPTGLQVAERTTQVSGIYNAHYAEEEYSSTYRESLYLPYDFRSYPITLTSTLLEQFEYIFTCANKKRIKLKLDEL